MKKTLTLMVMAVLTFCLCGADQAGLIVLTSKDVDKASVRVITQPKQAWQNLVFRYVGKSSAEIKSILDRQEDVAVMKNGVVVTKTDAGCAALTEGTNYIGLVLVFSSYDQAKLAEKTLKAD